MSKDRNEKATTITIYVDRNLYELVREHASMYRLSISSYIRMMIMECLREKGVLDGHREH